MLELATRNVVLGASLLGIVGGALGCFALLRRQSLLGDAIAHAALPGVCLAYLITGNKGPESLLAGALIAGVIGALLIVGVVRMSRIKEDTAIGIVLSVFFGGGIVLLTYIQKLPWGNQSGLDKFLFGQAASLMSSDVQVMAGLGGTALLVCILFFKELKLLAFDREFAASMGLPVRSLELLLTVLLVVVVVVGLQTVGVVLIVATLITPAAAARQWTERLSLMLVVAAAIGGLSGAVGAAISAAVPRMPTGPVIVLCASSVLVLSILAAPQRGLLHAHLAERRAGRRIREENLLRDLYLWGERRGGDWSHAVSRPVLMGSRGLQARHIAQLGRRLAGRGLVEAGTDGLVLTEAGNRFAKRVVRKHRLWESYLARRLELPSDHVHRDADVMEHVLSDDAVEWIDRLLGHPRLDPHGRPIPEAEPT